MIVANPIDPSFPALRIIAAPGPSEPYPREPRSRGTSAKRDQRGQLPAVAAVVIAVVAAFGAGFAGGLAAATPAGATPGHGAPVPGEFRLGPGNLTPPGIVVPLD